MSFNWDFVDTVDKVETEPAAEYNFNAQSLSENRIFEQFYQTSFDLLDVRKDINHHQWC